MVSGCQRSCINKPRLTTLSSSSSKVFSESWHGCLIYHNIPTSLFEHIIRCEFLNATFEEFFKCGDGESGSVSCWDPVIVRIFDTKSKEIRQVTSHRLVLFSANEVHVQATKFGGSFFFKRGK